MKFVLQPWQLFVLILASWINRQQQEVIEYLRTENAVLKVEPQETGMTVVTSWWQNVRLEEEESSADQLAQSRFG